MKSVQGQPNNLLFYRKRAGYTQDQVARLLGCADTSMITHYEHGRMSPSLAVALALEIILRTPVAFLFPRLYSDLRLQIRKQEENMRTRRQPLSISADPHAVNSR